MFNREQCGNPWNITCHRKDIQVYIQYQEEQRPICRSCWQTIAKPKYEW
ncbi:MAG: hypothetical protein NWE83_10960 [Candidatus Bathyarchaeota archaeon]|nr:hypothetical protein [Candidatus Bathyarchaeota archaeon]